MILSLQAYAPAALLLAGGLVLLVRPSTIVFVLVQLATLLALLRLSQIATFAVTVPLYEPLADIPIQLRLDRLSLFFATSAVAGALLVSLPWAGRRDLGVPLGWMVLAEFGALCAILSGNLQGLAAGWGAAVAALLMLVILPEPGAARLVRPGGAATRHLVLQLGGAVLLTMGAVAIEASAGTAGYDAVPIGAVDARAGLLLAASPILALATLAAAIRACRRPAAAAVMVTAVTLPMSAYVMARTVDLAGGRLLPTGVAVAIAAACGILSGVYGVYAMWAPDLGSAVSRMLNALGLLVVAAFALGGSTGLVALIAGYISLQLVAGSLLTLLHAGAGRLPGEGQLPRWAAGVVALVPLAALAGLVVGFGLDARLLLLRRLVELGPIGILAGVPLALAVVAIAAGAWAAARFGGGRLDGRRGVVQVGLILAALVGAEAAAPLLRETAVSLAAAASRVPVADVRSSAGAALPAGPLAVAVLVLVVAGLALVASRPRAFSSEDGLRGAPDMLPPTLAVVPGIAGRRLTQAGWARLVATSSGSGPGMRLFLLVAAWAGAALVVMLAGR
ncbi:MAG: hypothetical protein QOK05_2734 [Chloroflexota bacterium]|jgi:hypothetical protein|nr:hypothetical protein [Chloroflexota bacterium]